jgi:hypothetical protein
VHPRYCRQLRQTVLVLPKFIRRDEDVDLFRISNELVDELGRLEQASDLFDFWLVLVPISVHIVPLQGGMRLKKRVLGVEGGNRSKLHLPELQGGLVCTESEVLLQGGDPIQTI